jgi:orotate phosphoribosyltransferase
MQLRALHDTPAYLSIAGKDGSTEHMASIPGCYTVLVDNAIVSGRTMETVLGKLRAGAFTIDLILYLFDREEIDSSDADPALRIADAFSCEISSVFSLRDIIAKTGSQEQRTALLRYAQKSGNQSIRAYLKDRLPEHGG